MERIEGFIDIGKILEEKGINLSDIKEKIKIKNPDIIKIEYGPKEEIILNFLHNGENYFYKYNWKIIPYSELVACELAKDFGLSCCEYDLAILDGRKGVISKNFKKENTTYTRAENILTEFWHDDRFIEEHNNLEDIWDALEYRYQNHPNKREVIENLMNKIVSISIFDIIVCNYDRHTSNWGIMENNEIIDIAPLYDNERILSTSGKDSFISLTMEDVFRGHLLSNLRMFNKVSTENYIDFIKSKMWIISEENLKSVFTRIEEKTSYPMKDSAKEYYLKEYESHRKRLEKILNYYDKTEERDEQYEGKSR